MHRTIEDEAIEKIWQLRTDLGKTMADYSRGTASCEDLHKATRRLADAHFHHQEVTGNRAPDRR